MTFKPTAEQEAIIEKAQACSLLKVEACSGSGKTSTLHLVTQAIRKPTLYMAFNKVMADEAAAKFGSHVTCRTVHSIAYREVAAPYAHRLSRQKGAYKNVAGSPKEIALFYRVKGIKDMISDTKMGYWIKTTVATFEQSADDKVCKHHVPVYDIKTHLKAVGKRKQKKNQPVKDVNVSKVVDTIHKAAVKLWNDRIDKTKDILITHDTYLKLYQLSKPVLPFDVVMLDEAQDANPVIVDIVLQQRNTAKVILVGDSYQQIYQWRGAINALERVTATTCYLTKSFRFGDAIANVANAILDRKDFVKGCEKIDSKVDIVDRSKPYTMLFRTNAALVQEALSLISDGVKVRLETNLSDFRRKMESVLAFYKGDMKAVKHHDVVGYECWDDFVEASEYDLETKRMIVMAQKNELEDVLDILEGYRNPSVADIVLSTAHKSKGLEWDQVILADDFKAGLDGKPLPDAERNLLYVAATRAKKVLEVNNVTYICMLRYLQGA